MALRFLMLSFDYVRPKDPTVSLAAASLMAKLSEGLSKFGHNFELYHRRFSKVIALELNVSFNERLDVANNPVEEITEEVVQCVKDFRPDAIGAGVYVWNEPYVSHAFWRLSIEWSKSTKPLVILGGPQITYSGRGMSLNEWTGTLERLYPWAEAYVRGYAEQTLTQLLSGITLNSNHRPVLKGVHYSGDEDLGQLSDYSLGGLPSPLISGHTIAQNNYIRYETKRGCAFRCAFCQHKDSYEKRQECCPERIQREVQWTGEQNINDISIVDPIFNLKNSHYLKVMDLFLEMGFRGRLNLQTRLEMISEEFVDRCRQCLDSGIGIELECGVQTADRDVMRVIDRGQSLKRIERKASELNESGIPFEVSLIYGLPLQTVDSFEKTIDFVVNRLTPNRVRAWPLMLLKGTELYDVKKKYGLREKLLDTDLQPMDDMRQYAGIPHVISSSTFNENDWLKMRGMPEELNKTDLKLN